MAIWQQTMYEKKVPENIDAFRELLQDYGKVPPEEVESHLTEIVSETMVQSPPGSGLATTFSPIQISRRTARSADRISYHGH